MVPSIRVGDKDSHFGCDVVQSLPYCGPSLPQLLFDQHGTQKFKDHVGPVQQGQFLVEAWGTGRQGPGQDRPLPPYPTNPSLTSFTILFSVSCASSFCRPDMDLLRSGGGRVRGAGKTLLEKRHVPQTPAILVRRKRVGRQAGRAARRGVGRGCAGPRPYPSAAAGISPLPPAASSGSAQPWRRRARGRGALGLTLREARASCDGLAPGGDSSPEGRPLGAQRLLPSYSHGPGRSRWQLQQDPKPKHSLTLVLPSVMINPEVNKGCWECYHLMHVGNCSSDAFNKRRSAKNTNFEDSRQDGERKTENLNAPFLGTWSRPCLSFVTRA